VVRRLFPSIDRLRPGRTVLAVAVGAILTAAVIWLSGEDLKDREAVGMASSRVDDPHAAELARCNAIGSAALDDAACRAAWAENRRRFFGGDASATGEGAR